MIRLRLVGAAVALAALAFAGTVGGAAVRSQNAKTAAAACPAGFISGSQLERTERRAGIAGGDTAVSALTCVNSKRPERAIELILRQEQLETARSAPYDTVAPGRVRRRRRRTSTTGSARTRPRSAARRARGSSTAAARCRSIDPDYSQVNGLGLVDNMGRLDSLEYDAANNRLFAAKGTGGVWLSEDLGNSWRSIGDGLPSQIVGAVGYTPANGGTVLAIGGDATFGGGGYTGFGAFYTHQPRRAPGRGRAGIPDGALGFAIEADPANPTKVYAATSQGLYRSIDGGKTYANVQLPTGACAGVEGGGSVPARERRHRRRRPRRGRRQRRRPARLRGRRRSAGARATAPTATARSSRRATASTGRPPASPGRSRSSARGLPSVERIGRVELGDGDGRRAGPGLPLRDRPGRRGPERPARRRRRERRARPARRRRNEPERRLRLQGLRRHLDASWPTTTRSPRTRRPGRRSSVVGQALGYEPGVQAWYNVWIAPDPTRQDANGVPTRLAFGLEEVWQNELSVAA